MDLRLRVGFGLGLALVLVAGCRGRLDPGRLPTEKEAGPVKVVVNYGPRLLRVFPTRSVDAPTAAEPSGYLILASERPELPALFRPLAVTLQRPALGTLGRAGSLGWVMPDGHIVEAPPSEETDGQRARFLVYDRDAKVATPVAAALPAPCPQTARRPPLLQGEAGRVHAVLRCEGAPTRVMLLDLDGQATVQAARTVALPGPADVELALHQTNADYLLAGGRLLRVAAGATTATATALSGLIGPAETHDLVPAGDRILVIDGSSGTLWGFAADLSPRFERHFPTGRAIRVRAAVGGPERVIVVSAEAPSSATGGSELVGVVLPLAERGETPVRLRLGSIGGFGAAAAPGPDHELVPVSSLDGGGALLIYTHIGNTGPQVALRRLTL